MSTLVCALYLSRLGLDKDVLAKLINTSTGQCWSSQTYNPCPGVVAGVPSSNDYNGGFASELMTKDLLLALGKCLILDRTLASNAFVLQKQPRVFTLLLRWPKKQLNSIVNCVRMAWTRRTSVSFSNISANNEPWERTGSIFSDRLFGFSFKI